MGRKKIEIEKGGIRSVNRELWGAAISKMGEARLGISEMERAADQVQFEEGWARFVNSIWEFWVRFYDEGKSEFSNFQPWVGASNSEQNNQLLRYVKEARHQSQHSRIKLDWGEPILKIAPNFNGHVQRIQIFEDGTYDIESTPAPGARVAAIVEFSPGDAKLPIIENKNTKEVYDPPEASPIEAAEQALKYYEGILEKAFDKFKPNMGV